MRRRTLALGVILLGGAALVLFCCAGRDERGASAPAKANSPGTTDPARGAPPATDTTGTDGTTRTTAPAGTASGATPGVVASATGTASAGAPPAGPGARIASAVQTSDPRDLELLASVERELKRDPPREVHAIVAARKRGASRAELASMIAALPDLGLRALTFRWLDTVLPSADAGIGPR